MVKSTVYDSIGIWLLYIQLAIFIVFFIFILKFIINILKENNMKFGLKQYWKPTPKKIRKFADSLSAAALAVSAYTFMTDYKVVSYVVLASAFVGKFASNLFSEEDVNSKTL